SSSRSAFTTLTPASSSRLATASSEKRDTAITRAPLPAASSALRASIARLGPIFPPAPRSRRSPSTRRMSSTRRGEGSASFASSSATEANDIVSLRAAPARGQGLEQSRHVAGGAGGGGGSVGHVLERLDGHGASVSRPVEDVEHAEEPVLALPRRPPVGVVHVHVGHGAGLEAARQHLLDRLGLAEARGAGVDHRAQGRAAYLGHDRLGLGH